MPYKIADTEPEPSPHRRKRAKRPEDDKTARIDIRVTPVEKQQLTEQAKKLGLNLSEFVLICCAKHPETLTDILRKARPAERVDPHLITALIRANLQLAEIRDQLTDHGNASPALTRAILTTLIAIHTQLRNIRP